MKKVLLAVLAVCMFLCGCTEPNISPSTSAGISQGSNSTNSQSPTKTPSYTLSPIQSPSTSATQLPVPIPTQNSPVTPSPMVTQNPMVTQSPMVTPKPTVSPDGKYGSVEVTYHVETDGTTFTDKPSLWEMSYTVYDPTNKRGLSEESYEFTYGKAQGGKPHNTTVNNQKRFDGLGYNALAWDNKTPTSEKVLYLTFDCGYKYEDLTIRILDTLKEKDVKAAFFCTMPYLKTAPEEITRMINEGHIVGNHSTNHPSDCAKISRETLAKELLGVHNYLRVKFGYTSRYFRFPTGRNSTNALELVDSIGYRSIFWSVAHRDWDPKNQPGEDVSFETVTSRLHPGAVILLHSTSPDNAAILGRLIDYARDRGYTFRSLDEYDYWSN